MEIDLNLIGLKRELLIEDIIIYDKNHDLDETKQGYNIGDLLNMPYLSENWKQTPHKDLNYLKRMLLIASLYENSILNNYCENRPLNEPVPNIPRIIDSVNKFTNKNKNNYENLFLFVQKPDCLCVHIRSGDLTVEDEFVKKIRELSYEFKYIILFSGVHSDESYKENEFKINNFYNSINNILKQNTNIYFFMNRQDVHLSLMSVASNLLIHKGGFAALASIISTGNLFITRIFIHAFKDTWIQTLNKRYTLLEFNW
jgi:hypothetical protein